MAIRVINGNERKIACHFFQKPVLSHFSKTNLILSSALVELKLVTSILTISAALSLAIF
jgi:hypothetical protein